MWPESPFTGRSRSTTPGSVARARLAGSRQLKGRHAGPGAGRGREAGDRSGRARMSVLRDFKATTVTALSSSSMCVRDDGLHRRAGSFTGLPKAGFRPFPRTQPLRSAFRKGAQSVVPLADRAIGNLQQWLIGTYHGVSRAQLQAYLDEFVFRHNRRRNPMAASNPARPRLRAHADTVSPPSFPAGAICVRSWPAPNRNIWWLVETTG